MQEDINFITHVCINIFTDIYYRGKNLLIYEPVSENKVLYIAE